MDVQDLLSGVEAVYSDHESGDEYEEAASVSIFPITVTKIDKPKPEKIKKQDLNKFSYPCEHCPNVYSNRGALWQHSVATHSVEKTCECKICGRKFYRNCSLALHLKSHSEEEYCQCKECGKSFNRLANLERHMRVHTDAEQFPCPYCEKVFRDKTNLQRHIVVHPTPKKFRCDLCNKFYKSDIHLDIHNQTYHSNAEFPCPTCGLVCPTSADLVKHERTHSTIRTESSNVNEINLKKALWDATGERLTCILCGIDFTQKSSLLRHVKRMHPQENGLVDQWLDGYDGSSENGSVQESEHEEGVESVSNSTVEIRKALGSPVKSGPGAGGLRVLNIEQLNMAGRGLVVESHRTEPTNGETDVSVVMNKSLEAKIPPGSLGNLPNGDRPKAVVQDVSTDQPIGEVGVVKDLDVGSGENTNTMDTMEEGNSDDLSASLSDDVEPEHESEREHDRPNSDNHLTQGINESHKTKILIET